MSSRALLFAAAIGAAGLVCCLRGGSGRPSGEPCDGSGQCREGLLCSYGRCRPACTFDRDCPEGAACLGSEETGVRVCSFADEGADGAAPCPGSLDEEGVCRQPCDEPGDCGEDRLCVEGLCRDDGNADVDAGADADADLDTDEGAAADLDADEEADADLGDADLPPAPSDFGAECGGREDCESGECFWAGLDYPFLCYGSGCTVYCDADPDCVAVATQAGVPRPEGAFCARYGYCDLVNTGLPQFYCE